MKILFQGDSITDAGRNTTNGSTVSIGQGYPMLISGMLGAKYPGKYEFVNRGVSGNRVVDVYARIKADVWNHNPDVLSLLIGVNDVWHELDWQNGVDVKRFTNVYRMLIEDTLEHVPGIRMILMEPFVLHGIKTDENWDAFLGETRLRAEAVASLAAEYRQTFLPLQRAFEDACALCPASYWVADGVHPTPAGHGLIANAWIEAFQKLV